MAMRPIKTQIQPSLLSKTLALALSPAVYASSIALSVFGWSYRLATAAVQLPVRLLVACLQLVDSFICDVLAFLTTQPGPRAQIGSYQQTISNLQQQQKLQQRQILLLQNELDGVKLEKSKAHIRNMELADKMKILQQRVSKHEAAAAALTVASQAAAADAAAAKQLHTNYSGSYQSDALGVKYDAKGWYLHACVGLATLAVRWWLTNQTDPLQRKVMLVVIWPIAWVYGAMLFNCLPRSSTLRAVIACCCWALLGYVANEMVSFSVRERQQSVCIGHV